jgi:uncharacterized membrane protein YdjX (TVP38/TMEM64 family)
MNRYALTVLTAVVVLMMTFVLAQFVATPLQQVGFLENRSAWLIALICVALLASDVVLPVPSSLLMMAGAAALGFWSGVAIALVGSMLAALFGYCLGYCLTRRMNRFVPPSDLGRGEAFFVRWGIWAVVLSRPVPLMAETVSIFAGVSRQRILPFLAAALAGNLPVAALFSAVGSKIVIETTGSWLIVATLLLVLGAFLTHLFRNLPRTR